MEICGKRCECVIAWDAICGEEQEYLVTDAEFGIPRGDTGRELRVQVTVHQHGWGYHYGNHPNHPTRHHLRPVLRLPNQVAPLCDL